MGCDPLRARTQPIVAVVDLRTPELGRTYIVVSLDLTDPPLHPFMNISAPAQDQLAPQHVVAVLGVRTRTLQGIVRRPPESPVHEIKTTANEERLLCSEDDCGEIAQYH